MLPVISRRLKTGIPMIHIFQCLWPNPSAQQLLRFLPFHNQPNLQHGRSGCTAQLCKPHASEPVATKHPEPRLQEPEAGELQGWFAKLRWSWFPDASTHSLRGGLEAQLAARVTQNCWAERSVWSHCTSQGAFGVPNDDCSSIGLMAWPHMDLCLRPGRLATTSQAFPVNPTALLLLQKLPAHCYLFHPELHFISLLL